MITKSKFTKLISQYEQEFKRLNELSAKAHEEYMADCKEYLPAKVDARQRERQKALKEVKDKSIIHSIVSEFEALNKNHITENQRKSTTDIYNKKLTKLMMLSNGEPNQYVLDFMTSHYDIEGLECLASRYENKPKMLRLIERAIEQANLSDLVCSESIKYLELINSTEKISLKEMYLTNFKEKIVNDLLTKDELFKDEKLSVTTERKLNDFWTKEKEELLSGLEEKMKILEETMETERQKQQEQEEQKEIEKVLQDLK